MANPKLRTPNSEREYATKAGSTEVQELRRYKNQKAAERQRFVNPSSNLRNGERGARRTVNGER
jgi:hypothetical protein